jgi:hypothetical protein
MKWTEGRIRKKLGMVIANMSVNSEYGTRLRGL